MSNWLITFVAAFILFALAMAGLALGWLVTGKPKITRGTCGRDPTLPKDDSCKDQPECPLCGDPGKGKKNKAKS